MTTSSEPQASELHPSAELLAEALEAAAAAADGSAPTDTTSFTRTAAARFQSSIGKGAYYTTYGVSYGVVFTSVFLKELLPSESSLRRGFEQGVADGAKAAVGVWERFYALPDDALVNDALVSDDAPAEAAPQ